MVSFQALMRTIAETTTVSLLIAGARIESDHDVEAAFRLQNMLPLSPARLQLTLLFGSQFAPQGSGAPGTAASKSSVEFIASAVNVVPTSSLASCAQLAAKSAL